MAMGTLANWDFYTQPVASSHILALTAKPA